MPRATPSSARRAIVTTGNLKLDVPAPPADADKLWQLQAAIGARPVIAAASTHPGEEAALIDAHRRLQHSFPGLLTIIAPRHPERGAGIAEHRARARGSTFALRSRGELPDRDTDIYVADTLGELGLIYRLAPIVFIGGSLVAPRRAESDRGRQARRRHPARPACLEFRRDLRRARRRRRRRAWSPTPASSTVRIGAWLKDADARKQGGADRTAGDGHARRRARAHASRRSIPI